MLLHVSIIRSPSGSIFCSLLKLQFKTLSDLLCYINLVLWQHVMCCVCCTLFSWDRLSMCFLCCIAWDFNKEQRMVPEDDCTIKTCRNILSVYNVNFSLLKTIYVHLLVCYLNKLQNAWCNDKDIKCVFILQVLVCCNPVILSHTSVARTKQIHE